jgi:hypothetical protein
MFINVRGKEGMYHMQVGYLVAKGAPATGEVQVRGLAPALATATVVGATPTRSGSAMVL